MFDRSKFIDTYKAETREHIQKLNLGLIDLEKAPQDKKLLEEMIRESHTIKGASAMMGYKRIADLAHHMESGLQSALAGDAMLEKPHFDVLFKCLDTIEGLLEDKITWEDKGIERPFVDELCKETEEIFKSSPQSKPKPKEEKKPPEQKKEEPKSSPRPVKEAQSSPAAQDSMRVDVDKLNKMVNLSGEMLISKIRLNQLVKELRGKAEFCEAAGESTKIAMKELAKVNESIDFLSRQMQEEAMRIRMVPVSYLFNIFPRAMRDLADEKGKDIEFLIKGGETHLDRAILDQLKDPLMHILRNAVDHGIETQPEREKEGKPGRGTLTLSAFREGSHVIIEISDDG